MRESEVVEEVTRAVEARGYRMSSAKIESFEGQGGMRFWFVVVPKKEAA